MLELQQVLKVGHLNRNELHMAKLPFFNGMSHLWADQTARMEVYDSKQDKHQKGPFFGKNWFDGHFLIAELSGEP
jgi:hypothetical protein